LAISQAQEKTDENNLHHHVDVSDTQSQGPMRANLSLTMQSKFEIQILNVGLS
jgi:hypothetical protein